MKKLITAITASLILATGAMSNILEQDKQITCKLFVSENYLINKLKSSNTLEEVFSYMKSVEENAEESVQRMKSYVITSGAEGIGMGMQQFKGDLSIDLLKNIGIGTNTKLTWANLALNYNLFIGYLHNNNELDELINFYNAVLIDKINEKNKNKIPKEINDKIATIDYFLDARDLGFPYYFDFTSLGNKKFNELFKHIALQDFREALQLMKTENANAETQKVIDSIVEACKSDQTKTLIDLINY